MATGKGKGKKSKGGSSLTDAVVAALAKVEDEPAGEPAAAAEAGCASTQTAGANGFRNGPGSFADLMQRWAGGAPMPVSTGRVSTEPVSTGPVSTAPPPEAVSAPSAAEDEVPARTESMPAPEPPLVDTGSESADDITIADPDPGSGAPPPAEVDAADADGDHPSLADASDDEATVADESPADAAEAEPGGPVEVRYFGRTDVGLVREHNEDNFLVADLSDGDRDPDGPLDATISAAGCVFAVCDGMGGAAAGEVASQMAVDTVFEVMGAEPVADDRDDFARRLVVAIEEAGQRIFSAAKMDRSRRGMGTTATVAGMVDNVLFVGQVGDSRAYVLREDQFEQVTKDQSLVNQLIEAGQLTEEEAEAFEHSNIILQALGTTEEVTVDLTFLELRRGDRLMMCSDGLSGLVHGEMIKEVLQTTEDQTEAAAKLIQMANAGGGHDNITVIVADFEGDGLSADASAPVRYQQYPLPPSDRKKSSHPPRATSMKPGAIKPGADVKRDSGAAGPSEDVEVPTEGGSNAMLYLMIGVLLLVGAGAAWYLWGRAPEVDETPPPPPPTADVPDDLGPDEVPVPEVVRGTVVITTDVEDGTLYINGENSGPLVDRREVELPAGPATLEVRQGDSSIATRNVMVTEGSTELDLSVPVGAAEDLGEEADDPTSPEDPEPTGQADDPSPAEGETGRRRRGGRRGAGAAGRRGGRAPAGGQDGPVPTNPF